MVNYSELENWINNNIVTTDRSEEQLKTIIKQYYWSMVLEVSSEGHVGYLMG